MVCNFYFSDDKLNKRNVESKKRYNRQKFKKGE